MKNEPARIISLLTAAATAIIGLLVAFGANISDDQRNAVLTAIATVVPVVIAAGEIIRSQVTPTGKAEQKITEAYFADPKSDPKPQLTSAKQ